MCIQPNPSLFFHLKFHISTFLLGIHALLNELLQSVWIGSTPTSSSLQQDLDGWQWYTNSFLSTWINSVNYSTEPTGTSKQGWCDSDQENTAHPYRKKTAAFHCWDENVGEGDKERNIRSQIGQVLTTTRINNKAPTLSRYWCRYLSINNLKSDMHKWTRYKNINS